MTIARVLIFDNVVVLCNVRYRAISHHAAHKIISTTITAQLTSSSQRIEHEELIFKIGVTDKSRRKKDVSCCSSCKATPNDNSPILYDLSHDISQKLTKITEAWNRFS